MFKYKTSAELEALTNEELDTYNVAKKEHEQKELKSTIETAVKEATRELEAEVVRLKEQGGNKPKVKALEEVIGESKELLKAMASRATREELTIKAATLRTSIADNASAVELDTIGQLARRTRSFYEFLQKLPVGDGNHNGTIRYVDWDSATTVKAAAAVEEGEAFPESTAKFVTKTEQLKKVGDTLPVSDEFFEDQVLAAAELRMFLDLNVQDKIATDIINGNGVDENLNGILNQIPAYTLPTTPTVENANIYDLAVKVAEQITTNTGSKYAPDFAVMNIADINKLKLQKDAESRYLFQLNDGRILAMNIIEDNNVTANTMFMGDSRYVRCYEKSGVVLSEGTIDAQFTSDMRTLKAKKRLLLLVREADKSGFRKVTSISAALTALTIVPAE
jgi:HK97 family phage major capsid protein